MPFPGGDKGVLFALLDIDRFKAINDEYGHQVGDQVLQEVARRLAKQTRHDDCLVRWGGEEFLLVHFGIAPGQQAIMAERVCAAVRDAPVDIDESPLQVTVSVGIVLMPGSPEALALDWEQVVNLADAALYEAKRSGRNRWHEAPHIPAGLQDSVGRWSAAPVAPGASIPCRSKAPPARFRELYSTPFFCFSPGIRPPVFSPAHRWKETHSGRPAMTGRLLHSHAGARAKWG